MTGNEGGADADTPPGDWRTDVSRDLAVAAAVAATAHAASSRTADNAPVTPRRSARRPGAAALGADRTRRPRTDADRRRPRRRRRPGRPSRPPSAWPAARPPNAATYAAPPPPTDQPGDTRDGRVRAERDRRAGHRAVAQWANDNTADLRRLAGQITALTDLDDDAADAVGRLHRALADPDATALPALLADTQRHLRDHPDLAGQIDSVTASTEQVRRQTKQKRDGTVG